jgi:hypothetical protein
MFGVLIGPPETDGYIGMFMYTSVDKGSFSRNTRVPRIFNMRLTFTEKRDMELEVPSV